MLVCARCKLWLCDSEKNALLCPVLDSMPFQPSVWCGEVRFEFRGSMLTHLFPRSRYRGDETVVVHCQLPRPLTVPHLLPQLLTNRIFANGFEMEWEASKRALRGT